MLGTMIEQMIDTLVEKRFGYCMTVQENNVIEVFAVINGPLDGPDLQAVSIE